MDRWVADPGRAGCHGKHFETQSVESGQVKDVLVRVATHEASVVNNREIPEICRQHMVAVMMVDKTVTFRSAHENARMKDPAVLRERAKVQLIPDEELEKRLPRREGIVEVVLTDVSGSPSTSKNVRGTVENPMSREEVIAKARDLVTPVLGAAKVRKTHRDSLQSRKPEEYSRPSATDPTVAAVCDQTCPK